MSFRAALDRHLLAIRNRDLDALEPTLADELLLVMSDGRLVRDRGEFLELHRGWFAMDNWTLDADPVHLRERGGVGIAVLKLTYRETPKDRPAVQEESLLTLVFEESGGEWRMVQDQNTPIRQT